MKSLRIAAATINTTPLAWADNFALVASAIAEAKRRGVGVLCLPELCLSGYGCEDMFLAEGTTSKAMALLLEDVLPLTVGLVLGVGLPVRHRGAVYNCVATFADGRLLGLTAKQNLAGDGIHYEPRWFKEWPEGVRDVTEDGIPIGDLHYSVGGLNFGYEICEDAWVATRPGIRLAAAGVDLILNPSASHFAFGKVDTRERFVIEGSRAFGCGYVYANLCGNEAGRVVYDGGAMIAASGEILARGNRFHRENLLLTTAILDVGLLRTRQAATSSRKPSVGVSNLLIKDSFQMPVPIGRGDGTPEREKWELNHRKEEEFTRALCMALYDYMGKSRTSGFVVSLSGGADSAAVVCLVRYLGDFYGIPVEGMLTTVYQSTKNSSDVTRNAAKVIAGAAGARHHEIDVDAIVDGYIAMTEKAIGRKLTWGQDDLTLQNIQARSRGPSAWMLTNIENKLLLATSNRSEAAVGYATMDGDTCGALSPISGIDKAFLRVWLAWARDVGPYGLKAIPEIRVITDQEPTAELRPVIKGKKQTDEDDLMPYPELDRIEKLAIRDKKGPGEIVAILVDEGHLRADVLDWVKKFFFLWCRNQWKRERFAPGIHLDDENLDPRSWCRFPILSGGFQEELERLN